MTEWHGLLATQPALFLLLLLPLLLLPLGAPAARGVSEAPPARPAPAAAEGKSSPRGGRAERGAVAWWGWAAARIAAAAALIDGRPRTALNAVCLAVGCLSAYEIARQPAFVNDWPAHLHHVEQWREGRLDYEYYMHYHGHNAYPAAFLYTYTALEAATGGSIRGFQVLWALVEVASLRAIGETTLQLQHSAVIACLPALSNRLHLYHTRVVTNDGLNVALMLCAVRLLAAGRAVAGSLLYALTLALKLNFVTYLPAWLWVLWRGGGGGWTGAGRALSGGGLIVGVQVLAGAPFLLGNARAYLAGAYNLGRSLLWDKTRVFRFVGRHLFGAAPWHRFLLGVTAGTISCVLLAADRRCRLARRQRLRPGWPEAAARGAAGVSPREALFVLLAANQMAVGWARALYTPFLAWNLYALPLVLALAGVRTAEVVLLFVGVELLFRPFAVGASDAWAGVWLLLINLRITYACIVR